MGGRPTGWRTAKFLLVLASTVILDSESHILLCDGFGSLQSLSGGNKLYFSVFVILAIVICFVCWDCILFYCFLFVALVTDRMQTDCVVFEYSVFISCSCCAM
jgi:hypothetical protein